MLTSVDSTQFKKKYKQKYWDELSEEQALELWTILLDTFRILLDNKRVWI